MHLSIPSALALILSSPPGAQAIPDLSTAAPTAGQWNYGADVGGSDARFSNSSGIAQLVIHCTRSTRQVTILKAATPPQASLNVWTSSETRSLAASFNPANASLTVKLQAQDPLLDALSTSRGRIGISAGTEPPLVVPPWPEIARVVEDCRS